MKAIVKPTKLNLDEYIKIGIINFLLPLEDYAVEYTNYYSLEDIKAIRKKYPKISIFISLNKSLLNREIEDIKTILLKLDTLNIQGIFYYDVAILNLKRQLNLKTDLVWSQTHMVTNYKTCNYYYDKGVKYCLLSKEITKEEILEICDKTKLTPIVELISYPTVAFSKRKLVTNYYKDAKLKPTKQLNIIETKSKQPYLLVEDRNGVSFISKKLVNGSKILRFLLKKNIQYILLKEDLINHEIFLQCLENIVYYIENYQKMSNLDDKLWLEKQNELLGRNTNFLYRRTIYRVK